jgi:hypothetical protein
MRISLGVGVVVATLACACGLGVVGEAGGGGGATNDAGGSPDASAASDASTADAPTDSAASDAGVDADADAGPPTWCQSATHKLCVDFDDGTYGGGTSDVSSNAAISLDTTDSSSAPGSLQASFTTTSSDNRARLVFPSIASGGLAITMNIALKIDTVGTSGALTHLFTLQDADANVYGVRLSVDSMGRLGAYFTGTSAPSPTILETPAPSGWFHVVLLCTPTGVTITVGSSVPKIFPWIIALPANPILKLGLVGASSVPATVHYDDVTLD